jgi:hypothetical protein
MLKRRHLGVDTWAAPIRVEVSTPSVDAQQLTDITREIARSDLNRLQCAFEVSMPLFNRWLLSKAFTLASTLQHRHFQCIGEAEVSTPSGQPPTPLMKAELVSP